LLDVFHHYLNAFIFKNLQRRFLAQLLEGRCEKIDLVFLCHSGESWNPVFS
jgi:hypothetical protein